MFSKLMLQLKQVSDDQAGRPSLPTEFNIVQNKRRMSKYKGRNNVLAIADSRFKKKSNPYVLKSESPHFRFLRGKGKIDRVQRLVIQFFINEFMTEVH